VDIGFIGESIKPDPHPSTDITEQCSDKITELLVSNL